VTAAALPVLADPVLAAAIDGLTRRRQKSLPPWLFYDEIGSRLFERITTLPEYYLTRAERTIFSTYAQELVSIFHGSGLGNTASGNTGSASDGGAPVTIAELGAGSASKTGVLLRAFASAQPALLYQPIDISPTALDEAATLLARIPGVHVKPQTANYITEGYDVLRPAGHQVLALYIGSSIGNFSPREATGILRSLRSRLVEGDALLLGVDLAPDPNAGIEATSGKPVEALLAAYDDAEGVTAAFNKNVLTRLNRDLGADFHLDRFAHRARWNAHCSRMEMHLESLVAQTVHIPTGGGPQRIDFAPGETIHTENSYKFNERSLNNLLESGGFAAKRIFHDPDRQFAVVLANVQ
jgi:L-histidine N-alpha-methyltransferase